MRMVSPQAGLICSSRLLSSGLGREQSVHQGNSLAVSLGITSIIDAEPAHERYVSKQFALGRCQQLVLPAAAVAQVVTIDHQALNDARVALQQRQQLFFRLGQLTF